MCLAFYLFVIFYISFYTVLYYYYRTFEKRQGFLFEKKESTAIISTAILTYNVHEHVE